MKYVSVDSIEKTILDWAEQQFVKINDEETYFLINRIIADAEEIGNTTE